MHNTYFVSRDSFGVLVGAMSHKNVIKLKKKKQIAYFGIACMTITMDVDIRVVIDTKMALDSNQHENQVKLEPKQNNVQ